MALSLTLVNGDHDGTLDGTHALATVTGASGAVTFTAGRRHPTMSAGTTIAATSLGGGLYELVVGAGWSWWVTATDTAHATATDCVWIWGTNRTLEEEVAAGLLAIIKTNKLLVEKRMREVVPGLTILHVGYGMKEEVDVVPSIELTKRTVQAIPYTHPYGRRYTVGFDLFCYSHRSDDVTANQELLGQMGGGLRDMLLMYESWALAGSGLVINGAVPGDVEYGETLGPDEKLIGMATMPWQCETTYSIPSAADLPPGA